MPQFSSRPPYIKQIAIYFQQENHQEAYNLAEEFSEAFPDDMVSHFLFAKAAFWLDDYDTARGEAEDAFNLSQGQEELEVCGILLACAYYRMKEYGKGMQVLKLLKSNIHPEENLAKLKFIFALALHNEPAAMRHLDELYEINRKEARSIMLKFVGPEEE